MKKIVVISTNEETLEREEHEIDVVKCESRGFNTTFTTTTGKRYTFCGTFKDLFDAAIKYGESALDKFRIENHFNSLPDGKIEFGSLRHSHIFEAD